MKHYEIFGHLHEQRRKALSVIIYLPFQQKFQDKLFHRFNDKLFLMRITVIYCATTRFLFQNIQRFSYIPFSERLTVSQEHLKKVRSYIQIARMAKLIQVMKLVQDIKSFRTIPYTKNQIQMFILLMDFYCNYIIWKLFYFK